AESASTRPISALALIGAPSLACASALAAGLLLARGGFGLLSRPRGRLLLERRDLAPAGRSTAGCAGAALAEALLERIHQVDHLGALGLRRERGHLLALDLGLDRFQHARLILVVVLLGA